MSESILIEKAKRGDSNALAVLLQQNYQFLLKYLIKITMNRSIAEDLTQEAMLKAIEKISLYNGKAKFSSWLISIATHQYIDEVRKKKRERNYVKDQHAMRDIRWRVENNSSQNEWPEVLDVLNALTDNQRIPIILKHYYGYSLDEISEMMNKPVGTIKSRIHNGMNAIRKEMSENGAEKDSISSKYEQ